MSSTAISAIDVGLDEFFNFQRAKKRRRLVRVLRRTTLCVCVKRATNDTYSPDEMSTFLQQYRTAQKVEGATKYRIAARKYGRNAQWYILAGPNLHAVTGEGMTMAHAEWVAHDLSARMTSDYLNEILPSAAQHTMIQPRIEASRIKIEQALKGLLGDVRQDKSLWEAANNRAAEMIEQMTAADEAMLSELLNGDQP